MREKRARKVNETPKSSANAYVQRPNDNSRINQQMCEAWGAQRSTRSKMFIITISRFHTNTYISILRMKFTVDNVFIVLKKSSSTVGFSLSIVLFIIRVIGNILLVLVEFSRDIYRNESRGFYPVRIRWIVLYLMLWLFAWMLLLWLFHWCQILPVHMLVTCICSTNFSHSYSARRRLCTSRNLETYTLWN